MQTAADIQTGEKTARKIKIGFEQEVDPSEFKNAVQTETESPLNAQYNANDDFAVFATKNKEVGGFLNLQEKQNTIDVNQNESSE